MSRTPGTPRMTPPNEAILLLRDIRDKQGEQNRLLAMLIKKQMSATNQTNQWKNHNVELSKRCGTASDTAAKLMFKLVDSLVEDIEKISDDGVNWQGENFEFYELVDKYGQKLQQFSVIIQTLSQLGT